MSYTLRQVVLMTTDAVRPKLVGLLVRLLNDKDSLRFFKFEELLTFFGHVVKTTADTRCFHQVIPMPRVLFVDDAQSEEKNTHFLLLEALQKPPAMDEADYHIAVMVLIKICICDAYAV